jgi:hypothetical protein
MYGTNLNGPQGGHAGYEGISSRITCQRLRVVPKIGISYHIDDVSGAVERAICTVDQLYGSFA